MEMLTACEAFASLSQETRLRVFRLLIQYGRDGALAGKIASELKIPDNTLSFHLSHMSRAGLVKSKKDGRSVTYFANTKVMNGLVSFLRENCCVREKAGKKSNRIGC
ncbi:MAG: ArsR/SmtB family transcription factor [Bdellovibrionales bacterium]